MVLGPNQSIGVDKMISYISGKRPGELGALREMILALYRDFLQHLKLSLGLGVGWSVLHTW